MTAPPASVAPEDMPAYLAHAEELKGTNLPIIIDKEGDYITRAGNRVEVFAITVGRATFNCQGSIFRKTKNGKGETTEFQTWQANGRMKGLGESKNDIVAKA